MQKLMIGFCVASLCACTTRAPLPAPRMPLAASAAPRSAQPEVKKASQRQPLPKVRTVRLDNGFTLYLLEQHALPHVAIAYVNLYSGEDRPQLEQAGVASLLNQMVLEGEPESRRPATARGAAKEAPKPGTTTEGPEDAAPFLTVRGATHRHTSTIATHIEASETEDAIRTLAAMVRAPVLTEEVMATAKKRVQSSWDGARYNASGLARSYVVQRIYGPNHVLGQHSEWAVEHVEDLTLDAVREAYRTRYLPSASALVVVGDIQPDAVAQVSREAFGNWESSAPASERYAPSDWEPHGRRKVFVSDYGARLANVALGQRGPAHDSADLHTFEALVHILGGSFSSRLMRSLRAEQGLTYGITAGLETRRDGSTLIIETSVPCSVARKATDSILEEMRKLRAKKVDDAELDRAKASLIEAHLAQYEATAPALKALTTALELGDNPETYAETFVADIERISTSELQRVAVEYLQPEKAPIIVVGDLSTDSELDDWSDDDEETF